MPLNEGKDENIVRLERGFLDGLRAILVLEANQLSQIDPHFSRYIQKSPWTLSLELWASLHQSPSILKSFNFFSTLLNHVTPYQICDNCRKHWYII
jgi:hypothetical protein